MPSQKTKNMIFSALFMALGCIFPFLFHMAGLGKIFLPMFWPLAAAGFFVTVPFAVLVGILTPFLSFVLTGMPPVPVLQLMMVELAILSATVGIVFRRTGLGVFWIVLAGLSASRMLTWIAAGWVGPILGWPARWYALTRMLEGMPGLLSILIIVPLLISRIHRVSLFRFRRPHAESAP
ncbi:hypothetical protein JW948_13675 [bacterium]|nr:hypothetical protein [bacterium]